MGPGKNKGGRTGLFGKKLGFPRGLNLNSRKSLTERLGNFKTWGHRKKGFLGGGFFMRDFYRAHGGFNPLKR